MTFLDEATTKAVLSTPFDPADYAMKPAPRAILQNDVQEWRERDRIYKRLTGKWQLTVTLARAVRASTNATMKRLRYLEAADKAESRKVDGKTYGSVEWRLL